MLEFLEHLEDGDSMPIETPACTAELFLDSMVLVILQLFILFFSPFACRLKSWIHMWLWGKRKYSISVHYFCARSFQLLLFDCVVLVGNLKIKCNSSEGYLNRWCFSSWFYCFTCLVHLWFRLQVSDVKLCHVLLRRPDPWYRGVLLYKALIDILSYVL